jgi:methyl-accepting chemotaxis protein
LPEVCLKYRRHSSRGTDHACIDKLAGYVDHQSESVARSSRAIEEMLTNIRSVTRAGKGFAVVADEIRKLAENSGEQSKTISTVLKKIKDSIDGTSKSTGSVLGRDERNGHRGGSDQPSRRQRGR